MITFSNSKSINFSFDSNSSNIFIFSNSSNISNYNSSSNSSNNNNSNSNLIRQLVAVEGEEQSLKSQDCEIPP